MHGLSSRAPGARRRIFDSCVSRSLLARNICARHGIPTSVYSDNGTTFVGADRELQSAFRASVRDPNFLNRTASDQVSWHFLPPSAPHFGGLWEAGVRSVKHHLKRVIGSHSPTFESLPLFCAISRHASIRARSLLSPILSTNMSHSLQVTF